MPAGQLPVGGAMIYSEALASQLAMLNWWEHDDGESERISEGVGAAERDAHPGMAPRRLKKMMVDMFSKGDTYYISQEIIDVLLGGFDTLPYGLLGDVRPSWPYGWAFFEKPVVVPFPNATLWDLQGIAWGPVLDQQRQGIGGLNLAVFVSTPKSAHMTCTGMTTWRWGDSWDQQWGATKELELGDHARVVDRNGQVIFGQWLSKLIFSFFAFIRQECVTIQNQPAARPIRRHLPKSYAAEPIIKVIQLRRRSTATNADESVSVDYSCRWLVRGHWRNQFYPGSQSHRPRYIQPYVKGPDDKPLKPTKSSLFAVVR